MPLLHLVLNCACLLLWLNWTSRAAAGLRSSGIALVSTLRRADPAVRDRWKSPLVLTAVLLLRAVVYWEVDPWIPTLSLGAVALPFRNDVFLRMLAFSLLSFAVVLGAFYFCLLLVSAVTRKSVATDPWQHIVRTMLGPLDRLPRGAKLLLPFVVGAAFWLGIAPLLSTLGVHAAAKSFQHLLQESVLIGIGAFLPWKYAFAVVLGLYIVTTYVYLGNAPLWQFVTSLGRDLLRPLAWMPLQVGRLDLAPILMLIAVFALAQALQNFLPIVYSRLLQ